MRDHMGDEYTISPSEDIAYTGTGATGTVLNRNLDLGQLVLIQT